MGFLVVPSSLCGVIRVVAGSNQEGVEGALQLSHLFGDFSPLKNTMLRYVVPRVRKAGVHKQEIWEQGSVPSQLEIVMGFAPCLPHFPLFLPNLFPYQYKPNNLNN